MICEKCGKEIKHINTNRFSFDGSDYDTTIRLEEDERYEAVLMETDRNWTGYGLTEEEMRERIQCPWCGEFPFEHEEIQMWEFVRIVCFKRTEINDVKCNDCEHLMFSDCYGECSKGYKGIVQPTDSCGKGKRKEDEGK